jgi:hypothetical protein
MIKTVTSQVSIDSVRVLLVEFLSFAWKIQESTDDQSGLTFHGGCPVAQEMIGAATVCLLENLIQSNCIDEQMAVLIATNITVHLGPKLPTGPTKM